MTQVQRCWVINKFKNNKDIVIHETLEWINHEPDSNDKSEKPMSLKPRKTDIHCCKPKQAKTNQANGDTGSPVHCKEPQSHKHKQDKTDQADGADMPAPHKKLQSCKPKQDKTDQADRNTDPALTKQA
ncbi:hypothetical protein FRC06_003874 [Ceratobasidium sp. 370]|nr:hypothetical protein FRC06_003874 [Ceratobasidium sp. 370]